MDARELLGWLAFNTIEPIGAMRQDVNFAMVLQGLSAIGGQKSKVQDFLPFADTADNRKQNNVIATARAMLALAGGVRKKNG